MHKISVIQIQGSGTRFLTYVTLILCNFLILNLNVEAKQPNSPNLLQFVITSDSHFGLKRLTFRGDSNVYSNVVNAAMVAKINELKSVKLPVDGGVNAGNLIGGIEYLINAGDIANREEFGVQSSATSWSQFTAVYLKGLTLKNKQNNKTEVLLLPGNHDISNSIGYSRKLTPETDNTALVGIYNYMFPTIAKNTSSYNYSSDKIHYSRDNGGIHFVFINMWPDSSERVWIEKDLKSVPLNKPVIMFAHDQPAVESKHFTNPNGTHTINGTDKFENIIQEVFKDGTRISDPSLIEQRSFVAFLKSHPNIKVYFNGNAHENRMYEYKGPDDDISLKTFQVDSPMKGIISLKDETKLSFQLVTIDIRTNTMTVRECLWNPILNNPYAPVAWGTSTTISLN